MLSYLINIRFYHCTYIQSHLGTDMLFYVRANLVTEIKIYLGTCIHSYIITNMLSYIKSYLVDMQFYLCTSLHTVSSCH